MVAIHVIFIDYVRKISLLCEHYWYHSQQQKVNLSKCSKALKTFAQFVLLLLLLLFYVSCRCCCCHFSYCCWFLVCSCNIMVLFPLNLHPNPAVWMFCRVVAMLCQFYTFLFALLLCPRRWGSKRHEIFLKILWKGERGPFGACSTCSWHTQSVADLATLLLATGHDSGPNWGSGLTRLTGQLNSIFQ